MTLPDPDQLRAVLGALRDARVREARVGDLAVVFADLPPEPSTGTKEETADASSLDDADLYYSVT